MRTNGMVRFCGILLLVVVLVAACGPAGYSGSPAASGQPGEARRHVAVSIVPQQYFVERIGGDHVTVDVLVPPGADPHTYEPKPEQMARLSDTVAYFSIGVEFENVWLPRFLSNNPDMKVVDTTQGIDRMAMVAHHHHEGDAEHEEGEAHEHEAGLDPHVWVSPTLVKTQAWNIYQALVDLDPAHKDDFAANLEDFLADVDGLDAYIRDSLAGTSNRMFLVFHPAWGYFARDYHLEMIAIEVGGQEPSAAEMTHIIREAQEGDIHVIFAQPQTSARTAETIASEIGGKVLLIDPLSADWEGNLRTVADTFKEAMGR